MSDSRSTSRTPSPARDVPPAYSPPRPTHVPPSPPDLPKKPLPVITIPESKSLASTSTTSLQEIAPYRGSYYPPPPVPMGFHAQPHDGRPRDNIPYQTPVSMYESPIGFSRPSTAGRRTTMYFDANRTNRQSYMSYSSQMEKNEDEDKEEKAGRWNFSGCLYFWTCCR